MRDPRMCKVVVRCANCHEETRLCVPLTREGLPEYVRCDHDGHGRGGGAWACPRCGHAWPPLDVLVKEVEQALHRRPSEWKRVGAVAVTV